MIDSNTLVRWKALADKSLDEGSPEPERVASMRALAREVAKTLGVESDTVADTVPSPSYRDAINVARCTTCGGAIVNEQCENCGTRFPCSPPHAAYQNVPHAHAFDPHRCGACNHDADSHTAHVRNGTCFECTVAGRTCTRTRNEILGFRAENEPRFGRPTRARR